MPQTKLFELMLAPIRWQVLYTGVDLGVFDALYRPKTAQQIAAELNLDSVKTTLLLDAMCSLDFVEKEVDHYRLIDDMAPYLLSHSPTSMRDMLLHLAKVKHTSQETITHILTTGQSNNSAADFTNPAFWQRAVANLRSFHNSVNNQVVVNILQQLQQWPQVTTMLDLGAGSESLAVTLFKLRPDIKVSIFDLPPCASKIKQALSTGNADTVSVIAGNYNTDPLGKGYDIVWSAMSLYYADDLDALLLKIKDSLSPTGLFISFHEGLFNGRTKPEQHVVGRFIPALNGTDVSFDRGFIAKKLKAAGFSKVESRSIDTAYGPMELDIGYP